jgi:phosphoglycerate dehydrogenase-like enzyme
MKLVLPHALNEDQQKVVNEELSDDWTVVCATGDEYWSAMVDADATCVLGWPGEAPTLDNLKLIQVQGAGYDAVDFAAVPANACVCNVFEHEIAIAEYVMAAMLEWSIGLRGMDDRARRGDWSGTFYGSDGVALHGEIFGKTLGIVGYGHIGRETAKRAAAFGMSVLACSRTARSGDEFVARVSPMANLDEMLGRADFVLVSCPLTPETTDLIDTSRFKAMKPGAVIINIARGPVINEDALYAACSDGTIAGAVIDVWYRYPDPGTGDCMPANRPFQDLDNIIMSPHSSGLGEGLLRRRWRKMAENLNALAEGGPLENVIREPGGPPPD